MCSTYLRKNMLDWESHFAGKYGIVGELINEGEEPQKR